ncbi:hypothetical protein BBJ28_00007850, partial [Nothophytophthora sp. Chile5]
MANVSLYSRRGLSTPRVVAAERQGAARESGTGRRRNRSWVDEASPSNGESLALLLERGDAPLASGGDASRDEEATPLAKLTNALLYGVINSILTIPCMYGYAAIIFGHPDFAHFMPALSKLVM